jgi:hypothetical protein
MDECLFQLQAITCLENYIQLHIAFSLWILITVDKRFI